METTKLIEEYLDGTLSAEEHKAVELKAAADSDFMNLINLNREVNESIRDREFAALRLLTDKIGNEMLPVTRKLNPVYFRIAALFVLIAAASAVIKILFFDSHESRIYNSFYQRYETDIVSRSTSEELTGLDRAVKLYSNENYAEALVVLDEIIQVNNSDYMAWFFKGLSHLETNDPDKAVLSFKEIPDTWNSLYREHRNWYLALSLIKIHNLTEARNMLTAIAAEQGYYAAQASDVLSRLAD